MSQFLVSEDSISYYTPHSAAQQCAVYGNGHDSSKFIALADVYFYFTQN